MPRCPVSPLRHFPSDKRKEHHYLPALGRGKKYHQEGNFS